MGYYGSYGYYGYGMSSGAYTATVIIGIIVGVVMLVALWKLFTKAGEPGWKVLIPFYNLYVWIKLVWSKKAATWMAIVFPIILFVLAIGYVFLAAGTVTSLTGSFLTGNVSGLLGGGIAMIIGGIVIFGVALTYSIMSIVALVKTGKAYGKSGGFLAGMVFLTPIFMCILAFGKAQYVGPNGIPAGAQQYGQQYQQYGQQYGQYGQQYNQYGQQYNQYGQQQWQQQGQWQQPQQQQWQQPQQQQWQQPQQQQWQQPQQNQWQQPQQNQWQQEQPQQPQQDDFYNQQ